VTHQINSGAHVTSSDSSINFKQPDLAENEEDEENDDDQQPHPFMQ
jgi:hypothetical protein